MELGEGLLQQGLVDAGRVLDGGLQQASGGQIVDQSRHPAGVVVDQVLDRGLEERLRPARGPQLEVEIGGRLRLGERMQMVADGDPVQHVAVSAEQFQQRRLAGQDQFQGRLVVEGRTNQQAEIGEGLGLEQVGLIQQDQQRPLGLAGMVADLAQELVFAPEGRLPQVPDQQPQQVVAGELGQVHVAGLDTGPAEFVPEAFQEGRFAHAAGAG